MIAIALGPTRGLRRQIQSVAAGWLTLVAMLCGYFLVYVLTPFDLGWHLHSALDRLFMQLWPTLVYLTFVTLAAPEELLNASDPAVSGATRLEA
jgi:hypothetical protein